MKRQLYEHHERCILVLDDGAGGGWAWSPSDYEWRKITAEFAGRVWTEGRKISDEEAKRRYRVELDQLPE